MPKNEATVMWLACWLSVCVFVCNTVKNRNIWDRVTLLSWSFIFIYFLAYKYNESNAEISILKV